ncbi:MAG: ParB N-terminal domain-containing protein [Chloroflexi bacterium]|nr:ParB N-terminal domain-containing protein [Chloroflexota bacterium]
MSSNRRKELLSKSNVFGTPEEKAAPTLRDFDAQVYSGLDKFKDDANKHVVKLVSIYEILPDVTQPRRALPSAIRAAWDGSTQSLPRLFTLWEQEVRAERAARGETRHFDLLEMLTLEPRPDADEEAPLGALEDALLKVINLAASIRRDGLTNPVTAVRLGATAYRLETGERRWLAYHLLAAFFPADDKWKKIPTRLVEEINVWRQASENTARQDLNAVGKARQYAVLMMDLLAHEQGVQFAPFEQFTHERQYYAQTLAFDKTPYGKREVLLNAMGLKSPAELNRCRKILALPDSVWTLADDLSAPQAALLACEGLPEEAAWQIVSSWNDSAPAAAAEATAESAPAATARTRETLDEVARNLERVRQSVVKAYVRIQREGGSPQERQQLLQALDDYERLHQQWLMDIRNHLAS